MRWTMRGAALLAVLAVVFAVGAVKLSANEKGMSLILRITEQISDTAYEAETIAVHGRKVKTYRLEEMDSTQQLAVGQVIGVRGVPQGPDTLRVFSIQLEVPQGFADSQGVVKGNLSLNAEHDPNEITLNVTFEAELAPRLWQVRGMDDDRVYVVTIDDPTVEPPVSVGRPLRIQALRTGEQHEQGPVLRVLRDVQIRDLDSND